MQITSNTLSAYHVQHVVRRAAWYEWAGQLLNLTEFENTLILDLFYWLDHLTNEGGKETRVPGENP